MSDDILTITIESAAARLEMSVTAFREHVLPHLAVIRRSDRLVRVPVAELRRWVEENAK